jgi:hypothetical protein
MVAISVYTTGISGIVYGGRYDFQFFVVFFIVLHGVRFLAESSIYYIRIFLLSGGIALVCSILIKFLL